MRLLTFFTVLLLAGCAGTKGVTNSASGKLNGSWIPQRQEIGGNPLPKALYEKQQLIISDSNYTVMAESIDKGIVYYDGSKMDIYGREGVNKGKHFTAVYKYENGELTVCYNLIGTTYPEAFDTKGKPMHFLSVFKKQ